MQIWVGITNLELSSLDLAQIELTSQTPMSISAGGPSAASLATVVASSLKFSPTKGGVMVNSMSHGEEVPDASMPIYVKAARSIRVQSLHRAGGEAHPHYPGDLRIERRANFCGCRRE